MAKLCKNRGFSLTEVLLAICILSVGMIFIAGVFPAAIYLTTVATERTIAAITADEAFAKIKLYGVDVPSLWPAAPNCVDFNEVSSLPVPPGEFLYPSTDTDISQKHYCFSALCRRTAPNSRLVQVTVFISRKTGPILRYYAPGNIEYGKVDWSNLNIVDWPRPVKVQVVPDPVKPNVIHIVERDERKFFNDGCRFVDNATGRVYRVMERYPPPDDDTILLDGDWPPGGSPGNVWVVPPPTGAGRYPCIAIYQKEIRF